ncbi:MAG: hypothetical protein CVT70_17955 [Alphaproteobacteria bacterium HGW-Alphaproteobacteria-1]|jgi:hypothetical protein|nr:MAG: hypothetical protein CVT70_17955 [Alphaproteobacteria bacterium HGW-Alphaproteobacteria-1]
MARTILVPEPGGALTDHWQSWWSHVDPGAKIVGRAGDTSLRYTVLADAIADVASADPDTFLVAHGVSCAFVARLLSGRVNLGIAGVLFVAPTNLSGKDPHARLFGPPLEELNMPTTVVASRTDPALDIDAAERLAAHWGSTFVDIGDAGHIDAASGFGPWPDGIALRDDLVTRARRYVRASLLGEVSAQRWAF